MPIIWDSKLDTGIDVIDHQHKRIVDYINDLEIAKLKGDKKMVTDVIEQLIDYTQSHFGFEESMMEEAGYKFVKPHKKVHELFTRRVAEMQSRFDAGEDIAAELHGMLSRWLFNHIRNEDHGYVDAAQAYLRMARQSNQGNEKEKLKAELLQELEQRQQKKGWLARLLSR